LRIKTGDLSSAAAVAGRVRRAQVRIRVITAARAGRDVIDGVGAESPTDSTSTAIPGEDVRALALIRPAEPAGGRGPARGVASARAGRAGARGRGDEGRMADGAGAAEGRHQFRLSISGASIYQLASL